MKWRWRKILMFLSEQYSMEDCKKMDETVDCFLLGEVRGVGGGGGGGGQ